MKKQYSEKLKMYSAIAGSLAVASQQANAQMVLRDINPDIVVNSSNPTYYIDIDGNGTNDFQARVGTYSYYNTTRVTTYLKGSYEASGKNTLQSGMYSGTVKELNLNDTIETSSSFNNSIYSVLTRSYNGNTPNSSFDFQGGETDKYIGVRFYIGTELHYGWIKVSLSSDVTALTIKEVGYEPAELALSKAGASTSVTVISNLVVTDEANNTNASDIRVSFTKASTETNVSGYKIALIPTADITTYGKLYRLQELPVEQYYYVPKTGANISTVLPASLLDMGGNSLVAAVPYTVFVESVGDISTGDALATAASSVTIGSVTATTESGKNISGYMYSAGNTVYLRNMEAGTVKIMNVAGSELYNNTLTAGDSEISLATEEGIYLVQLLINGEKATQKVFLRK